MLEVHNDRLQQPCYIWLCYSFFASSIERFIACCISAKKGSCYVTKNSHKFSERVTDSCASLSNNFGIFLQNSSKVPLKKLNLQKTLKYTWTSSQVVFEVSSRFFSYIYRSLLLSYTIDIFCIRIHICKTYFFPLFYSRDGKRKKNKS